MTTIHLPPLVRRSRRALAVAALVAALFAAIAMPTLMAASAPAHPDAAFA